MSMVPQFGYNGYGEFVFYRTYSRVKDDGGQENWFDVVIRVTEGTLSIRKDWYIKNFIHWDEEFWQDYARSFAKAMFNMYWLPPGRGLWAMGTPFVYERGSMALYNCFGQDTEFIVDNQIGKLIDYVDQEIFVLTNDSTLKKATVKCFGKQKLQKITFKPLGRGNIRLSYKVTQNHRWILPNGEITTNLEVGNRVQVKADLPFELDINSQEYIDGFSHGLIFGDGTQQTEWKNRFSIRLCKDPIGLLRNILERSTHYRTTCQPPSYNGNYVITLVSNHRNFKQIPGPDLTNLNYLRGFVDGWLEADGSSNKNNSFYLASINEEAINWLIKIARLVGYIPTGISYDERDTNFGLRSSRLCRLHLSMTNHLFEVCSITDEGQEEEVYCVVEPITESFVLAGGIPTGNCSFTNLDKYWSGDIAWLMDCLMHGVGVGFGPIRDDRMELYQPRGPVSTFEIPDSREGWCESIRLLLDSYLSKDGKPIEFIYDRIRAKGLPIRGFGGIASGPDPLIKLHKGIIESLGRYKETRNYDSVRLKTDIANRVGCCVVAGNVRRSAELACAPISDKNFLDLKNYEKHPDRAEYGWMSNNSGILEKDEDFNMLGEIARRVIVRGEPGVFNKINLRYGRVGKRDIVKPDNAVGLNPCAEIPLEDKEVDMHASINW